MLKSFKTIFLLLIFLSRYNIVHAGGLSTRFVEVTLENLELGKLYSVKGLTGRTIVIVNTMDDKPFDIAIEQKYL